MLTPFARVLGLSAEMMPFWARLLTLWAGFQFWERPAHCENGQVSQPNQMLSAALRVHTVRSLRRNVFDFAACANSRIVLTPTPVLIFVCILMPIPYCYSHTRVLRSLRRTDMPMPVLRRVYQDTPPSGTDTVTLFTVLGPNQMQISPGAVQPVPGTR